MHLIPAILKSLSICVSLGLFFELSTEHSSCSTAICKAGSWRARATISLSVIILSPLVHADVHRYDFEENVLPALSAEDHLFVQHHCGRCKCVATSIAVDEALRKQD